MSLLHAGIDTASIALWLGHANIQTTQMYLHGEIGLVPPVEFEAAPWASHAAVSYVGEQVHAGAGSR